MNVECMKKFHEENQKRNQTFKQEAEYYFIDKKANKGQYLMVDFSNKLFTFRELALFGKNPHGPLFKFYEVESYETKDTAGETVIKSKGGLTRAAVGAVTFGAAGAVVGATTSKKKVEVKNQQTEMIIVMNTLCGKRREIIIATPETIAVFDKILDESVADKSVQESQSPSVSVADELLKLNSLKEAGILT